jgi:hypothetical protein
MTRPRATFDRLSMSLRPRSGHATLFASDVPPAIGPFVRVRHRHTPATTYRFRDAYRRRPAGPLVDLAYWPVSDSTRPALPPVILTVRATMGHVMTPAHVAEAVDAVEHRFGMRHLVSQVELAVDWPGCDAETGALAKHLYVPRSRSGYVRRNEHGAVVYVVRGSRRSAVTVKVYAKAEDGKNAARLEVTFRRAALRRLRVRRVADLYAVDWPLHVTCRARVVASTYQLGRRIPANLLIHELLQRLCPADRRRVRAGFRDIPHLTEAVRRAVTDFQASWGPLHATPPATPAARDHHRTPR